MSVPSDATPYAADYDPELRLVHRPGSASTLRSIVYASQLLKTGEPTAIARAVDVVGAVLDLQVTDPTQRTFGQFPLLVGTTVDDLNGALFRLPDLIKRIAVHADRLPVDLRERLDVAIDRAVVAVQRRWDEEVFDPHRDHKAYTNIFLLYVGCLLLAGRYRDDTRLARVGAAQWRRWFLHVAYNGLDEFCSPTYVDVDVEALRDIIATGDEHTRHEARAVLEHLTAATSAVTHPVLKLPLCGSSRDYRRFLAPGDLRSKFLHDGATDANRADRATRVSERSFPHLARGRATNRPFVYQSWQSPTAGMGTMTGGNYFWQQLHCMVVVGQDERRRAVAFIPGSFTPTPGFVHQSGPRALCVFSRSPHSLHRSQWATAEADVPASLLDHGIGISSGWDVTTGADLRVELTAYGQRVAIDPFVIVHNSVRPARLTRVHRTSIGQGRFHDAPAEFDEFLFPADAVWFGCVVSLGLANDPITVAPVELAVAGDEWTFTSGDLRVRLHRRAGGEVTELYDQDWRVRPLFESPTHTLWPGELAERSTRLGASDH